MQIWRNCAETAVFIVQSLGKLMVGAEIGGTGQKRKDHSRKVSHAERRTAGAGNHAQQRKEMLAGSLLVGVLGFLVLWGLYTSATGLTRYQYYHSQPGLLYSPAGVRLLTSGDLRAVAGQKPQKLLLLVVTGKVYNVTAGRGYYAAGEGYDGFAGGRDASRAFIDTDLFERDGVDDLANLTLSDCTGVEHWRNFYTNHETYRFAGLHIGKFYDAEGQPTDALNDFEACARNAVEVTEVLKGFAAKAEADGKCTWQHTEPRFVECAPPLVPLRFEMPEKGMVCTCVDSPALLAALDATAKRPAGQFLPKPYDECTLDQSRCMLTPMKKAGTNK